MKIKISPSILAADYANLGNELKKCEEIGASMIHLDVMDGHFVPNISIGPPVIASLRKCCALPFDVHLMISDPLKYAGAFIAAGADMITFHVEAESGVQETIDAILAGGCRAGLVIKPDTPADSVFPYIEKLSMVLVMSVEPGFGGQSFMPQTMEKVREIRDFCDARKMDMDIEVDGGITPETISLAAASGANVFVAGSALFHAENPREVIEQLIENAAGAK